MRERRTLRFAAALVWVLAMAATVSPVQAQEAQAAETPSAPEAAVEDAAVEGVWQGVLEVQAVELRLLFHVERSADGALSGTVDSPDQGATGIPLSAVTAEEGRVRFASTVIGGEFEGRLTAAGGLEGVWKQSGVELPLTLDRAEGEPEGPRRPQEPPAEVPYRVEEVGFGSLAEGVRLAGTLTLPEGAGPFPAVLLISGSGPQDRDETLMGHRPFAVLADHLTRQGIAVLRVDDRGVGESTGDFAAATSEDFADDAEAGFRWLRARAETDPAAVGLLGHSEGGIVAPMVAAREPAVAFLVLAAAPGVPGSELIPGQIERLARSTGADEAQVREQVTLQRRIQAVLLDDLPDEERKRRLDELFEASLAILTEEQREQAETALDLQRRQLLSPWFRFFLAHDPATTLRRVTVPVLAIWGAKDLQVPPEQNRPPLEAALAAAGNERVTTRVLPGLNHLLQTAETGLPTEYGRIEEAMAPEALELISGWIGEAGAAGP